jgi:hypothetical protein
VEKLMPLTGKTEYGMLLPLGSVTCLSNRANLRNIHSGIMCSLLNSFSFGLAPQMKQKSPVAISLMNLSTPKKTILPSESIIVLSSSNLKGSFILY